MLNQTDPRTPAITVGQGDTAKRLQVTLTDCSGSAIDLTGSSVVLTRKLADSTALVTYPMSLTDAANGSVRLDWPAGSNDVAGEYHFQIVITDSEGKTDTHPKGNYGYELMRVLPSI